MNIGLVRSKNTQHFYKIKRFLYGQYFLTDKGIFKFIFLGYYRKDKIYFTDVILPRVSQ